MANPKWHKSKGQREGQLATQLAAIIKQRNGLLIPLVASEYSMLGVCDKYLLHSFWRGFVELKNVGESLKDHQAEFIAMAVERGECCAVVTFTSRERLTRDTYVEVCHTCLRQVDHFGKVVDKITPPVVSSFNCTVWELVDMLHHYVMLARI